MSGRSLTSSRTCRECKGAGRLFWDSVGVCFDLCMACHGSGQVPALTSSQQARMDAFADAETFAQIANTLQPRGIVGAIWHHGRGAISGMRSRTGSLGMVCAELAARAAFRACPGLRCDR